MSESQRPKQTVPELVVPDLELEAAPRSRASGTAAPAAATQRGYSAPNLFDEDPFESGNLSIELNQNPSHGQVDFGSSINFEGQSSFELEPTGRPLSTDSGPQSVVTRRAEPSSGEPAWPSGRVPDAETLTIDPVEVVILADYGSAPSSAHLLPVYAYRVFTRQRELKQRLSSLTVERDSAEAERESTLADLARAVRPAAERVDAFRRFFTPLIELEQVASQRGQALSSVNAELGAHSATFDAELTQLAEQVSAQQLAEQEAERVHLEREQLAQRAEAKLKRVHIEIRAVTHVAEQKLGPQGGQIPEAEATQLALLRQRADRIQPEVAQTKADLEQAKHSLGQARAGLDALRQNERLTARKKQAVAERYQKELQVRGAGLSESETQQRTALAELARAVLAAHGSVSVPAPWLERVRRASERADRMVRRCETQRRALDAYDRAKVAQGVRLLCTAIGLILLMIVLKIVL
ncbi:MAG TPA: hypothetical protein VHW01_07885 [Polyangiaceae bacterium]|jgi:hypothetical protein|nr:hypothetical protein [Polyangiaceae bacterium]